MEKHAEALAKQAHDALGKIAKLEEEHARLLAEHDAEAHAKATVLAAKTWKSSLSNNCSSKSYTVQKFKLS